MAITGPRRVTKLGRVSSSQRSSVEARIPVENLDQLELSRETELAHAVAATIPPPQCDVRKHVVVIDASIEQRQGNPLSLRHRGFVGAYPCRGPVCRSDRVDPRLSLLDYASYKLMDQVRMRPVMPTALLE